MLWVLGVFLWKQLKTVIYNLYSLFHCVTFSKSTSLHAVGFSKVTIKHLNFSVSPQACDLIKQ